MLQLLVLNETKTSLVLQGSKNLCSSMDVEQDGWFDFMTVPQAQLCIAEVIARQACDKPQSLDVSQWDATLLHLCQARPFHLPAIERIINLVPSEGRSLKEVEKAATTGQLPQSTLLKLWQQQPQLLEEEVLRVLWCICEEEDDIGSDQNNINPKPRENIWQKSSIYHIANESSWVCSQVMDILTTVFCRSKFSKIILNAMKDFMNLLSPDSWDLYKFFPSSAHYLIFLLSVPPYLDEKTEDSVCKSGSNENVTSKEQYCHFVLMKLANYIERGTIEETMILKSIVLSPLPHPMSHHPLAEVPEWCTDELWQHCTPAAHGDPTNESERIISLSPIFRAHQHPFIHLEVHA